MLQVQHFLLLPDPTIQGFGLPLLKKLNQDFGLENENCDLRMVKT